jgi:hypothetical protein
VASWLRAFWYWLVKDPDRYAPEFAETPDPVDVHALSIPVDDSLDFIRAELFPPVVVAGSDIDASQWAGVVERLSDLAAIDVDRLSEFYLTPKE